MFLPHPLAGRLGPRCQTCLHDKWVKECALAGLDLKPLVRIWLRELTSNFPRKRPLGTERLVARTMPYKSVGPRLSAVLAACALLIASAAPSFAGGGVKPVMHGLVDM